jgi:hypothetical protein
MATEMIETLVFVYNLIVFDYFQRKLNLNGSGIFDRSSDGSDGILDVTDL